MICTNYLNSNFILLDVKLFKSQNSRLNENIGSFYDEYEVSEILFNSKNNVRLIILFNYHLVLKIYKNGFKQQIYKERY